MSVLAVASVSLVFFGASFLPGGAGEIWTWAQNLVGVSNQIAWLCIGIASWRFRAAWVKQGRLISDLKYPNPAGRFAAPVVVVTVSAIILIQGWSAFKGSFDAVSFVANYIELPLFLVLYVGWRLIKRVHSPTLLQIDLDSGRHAEDEYDEQNNQEIEQREKGKYGWAWRAYSAIF